MKKKKPELNLKTILLGVILSLVLAAANAYLALKIGMTISASIPAAVVSMAIFRLLRQKNSLLENNLVQTAASAGEALAAGVVFSLPALIILGYWSDFPYWQVALISLTGGLLGVIFTVPLRRIFLKDPDLKFPEGVATAEILKVGESKKNNSSIKSLAAGASLAATFKILQGLKISAERLVFAFTGGGGSSSSSQAVFAFGFDLSASLLAVGSIVGLNVGSVLFLGGALSWLVCLPIYTQLHGLEISAGHSLYTAAHHIWSEKIRFIGIGSMVVGSIWTLLSISGKLYRGLRSSMAHLQSKVSVDNTDKDISHKHLGLMLGLLIFILCSFFTFLLLQEKLSLSLSSLIVLIAFSVILTFLLGMIFSATGGYMAGLVGSSNNPTSSTTIMSILAYSLFLFLVIGGAAGLKLSLLGALSVLSSAVVCCTVPIAGDVLQDLKAGSILQAAPYKQQVMQIIGVIAAALSFGPILSILYKAYGIAGSVPDAAMSTHATLSAPQAVAVSSLVKAIFSGDIPWMTFMIGGVIAVFVIALDSLCKLKKLPFHIPVLPVAVGMYLPIELSSTIFAGAALSHFMRSRFKKPCPQTEESKILFASGLITGEALTGIGLALALVLSADKEISLFVMPSFVPPILGAVLFIVLAWALASSHKESYTNKQTNRQYIHDQTQ